MFQIIRRNVVVTVGAAAIALTAVACSGASQSMPPDVGSSARFAGFSIQLPPLTSPFAKPATALASTQSQTQTQTTTTVHSSAEGCPIALP